MSNGDYLVDHAVQNVWCNPSQDRNYIFKLPRLTKNGGARKHFLILDDEYPTPTTTDTFHVYMVGNVFPDYLNVADVVGVWVKLSSVCTANNLRMSVYTSDGYCYPLSECWMAYTHRNNLLIAVKVQSVIPVNLNTSDMYVQFFSNAFFNSDRINNPYTYNGFTATGNHSIVVSGMRLGSSADITTFVNLYNSFLTMRGATIIYHNGLMRHGSGINSSLFAIGDFVEIIYDSTVEFIGVTDYSGDNGFVSELDSTPRTLIDPVIYTNKQVRNGSTDVTGLLNDRVYYKDDCEVFIARRGTGQKPWVRYHLNDASAITMVGNKLVSINADFVEDYRDVIGNEYPDLSLVIMHRLSGYDRPLIREPNYLQELDRLVEGINDPLVVDQVSFYAELMLGPDAPLNVFRAERVEKSGYSKLLGLPLSSVTPAAVADAYGFPGTLNALGTAFINVVGSGGAETVAISPGCMESGHVLVYNSNGICAKEPFNYSGAFTDQMPIGAWLSSKGYSAVTAEVSPHQAWYLDNVNTVVDAGDPLNFINTTTLVINKNQEYRCYIKKIVDTEQLGWVDITNDPSLVILNTSGTTNDVITLNVSLGTHKTHIRLSGAVMKTKTFVNDYDLSKGDPSADFLFKFDIDEPVFDVALGTTVVQHCEIPYGQIEVFMRGFKLVPVVDYLLLNNTVTVYTGAYVPGVPTDDYEITYRVRGFCRPDLSWYAARNYGFVKYGEVSRNAHYNLTRDNLNRLFLGGAAKEFDTSSGATTIVSAESSTGAVSLNVYNGYPYVVEESLLGFDGLATGRYMFRLKEACEPDELAVEAYMSNRITETTPSSPNYVDSMHRLFSPFVAKLLMDCLHNIIDLSSDTAPVPDNRVKFICNNYTYLLDFDPTLHYPAEFMEFVEIAPHPANDGITVSEVVYSFLAKAIRIYLNDGLVLSNGVYIAPQS